MNIIFKLFPESQKGINIATMPGCKIVKTKLRKNSDITLLKIQFFVYSIRFCDECLLINIRNLFPQIPLIGIANDEWSIVLLLGDIIEVCLIVMKTV